MGTRRVRVPAPAQPAAPGHTVPRPRRRGRVAPDNLAAQPRRRSEHALEREADLGASRMLRGERAGEARAATSPAPPGGGRPLAPAARNLAETALGPAAQRVRVHDDLEAQLAAAALGARAFAQGDDIWLGRGESERDRSLMAHELAHVAQREPGAHLRSATWLERRAWLGFFDHYLPRKFLNNYMDDTGTPITLTQQEMIDVNPIVDITQSLAFQAQLAALRTEAYAAPNVTPVVKYIEVNGPGQARTNGTLGNFTIMYRGALTVKFDGDWIFVGGMTFYDVWDFDPKPFGTSGRSTAGELKTRVAAAFLPGRPFEIFSESTMCTQRGSDRRAGWIGGTPQPRPGREVRAGADIAVGGAGGEVAGGAGGEIAGGAGAGPAGFDVGGGAGGELGAQSAEDLNP
jgi:hypothetical protein